MSAAAERLIKVHNVRAFELWLANIASSTRSPALAWTSATVAVPVRPPEPDPEDPPTRLQRVLARAPKRLQALLERWTRVEPTVVVMIGLRGRALLLLGILHGLAWWRVRRTVGKHRSGYRVRVRFG